MITEIVAIVWAAVSSSIVTIVALIWLFVAYPEKVEKWVSMMARLVAFASGRAARTHMATDIQSTIDAQRKKLNTHEEIAPYGVSIKWSNADEVQTDLKENRILVMMRPYTSQSRNLAHVVSVYVPKALLPKARKYVEPNLMCGIDHVVSKSILESNTSALEYYSDELMGKIGEEVRSYVVKMDEIHRNGALTRMVLPELKRLAVMYPREPDDRAFADSMELARVVHGFVTKEAGVDVSPSCVGQHIRMAIVAVARPEKVLQAKTTSHFMFVEGMLRRDVDHFYIVSTGPLIRYAKELVEDCQRGLNLRELHAEEYMGEFRGNTTKMFCALLSRKTL